MSWRGSPRILKKWLAISGLTDRLLRLMDTMKTSSRSLSTKILVLLGISVFLIMVGMTAVSSYLRHTALLDEWNSQCRATSDRITRTMAIALASLDHEQVQELCREEFSAGSVMSLVITDPEGKILISTASHLQTHVWPAFLDGELLTLTREIRGKNHELLGTTILSFDTSAIHVRLAQILFRSIVQNIILILFTCIILYLGLTRLLLTPLRAILKGAEEFADGTLSGRIPVVSHDELGSLAETFNVMASGIEERILQLKEAEAKYRRLFETIQDAFYRTDREGTLILVSPSFGALLGCEMSDVIGHSANDFFVNSEESIQFLEKLKTTGHTEDTLITLKNADGTPVTVSTSSHYYYDEDGTRLGVEGLFRDVTERMDAFWEIERLKDSLTAVINSLPSIIFTVNRAGCVGLWNNSAEQFTGITAAAATGKSVEELLPQFAEQLPDVEEIINQQFSRRIDRLMIFKNGEQHFYEILLTPYSRSGGQSAVVRIDEITDKIRVEEIMIQTEKMMMIGGLAAGMAHEINNPLGAIMQSAQNIVRRVSTDIPANHAAALALDIKLETVRAYMEQRGILNFIEHIRESGDRAARIITSMMKFSRKSESHAEPANLAEVIDQTIELAANEYDLKKKYDFRHVEIVRDFEPGLPLVTITVLEIEQVLLNIIKNAVQAMATAATATKPRITFRTRRDGDFAVIDIEDNGPGMDKATRNRVFEPFFTTKEVGVGTGLGLSVSYTIITTNHHGSLKVRSIPGDGACFSIILPLKGNG
jgi:PAS domain S-box-containing protein